MNESLYLFLFLPLLFGFIHGFIFAVMLMYRGYREERKSDYILACLIGAGCLLLLPTILGLLDIHILWNEWLFLPLDPGLLIGPLIYFFVLAQTNRTFRFKRSDLVHLVPFMVYAVYHLAVFAQGSDFIFRWMDTYDLPFIDPVYKLITLGTMSAYLLSAIRTYYTYRKWVESEFASPEKLRYTWISRLLLAVAIAIIATCLFRLAEAFSMDLDLAQAWWMSIVVTLCIYYISIAGLFSERPPIYTEHDIQQRSSSTSDTSVPHYTETELESWLQSLTTLMESRHVYLNPDISLGSVAKELGLSRKNVSAAINAKYGTNFRRFVNEYRVKAFKNAVSDGKAEEMTLYGLALDSGFNSKATFNRVFKQIAGMAPNEYALRIKDDHLP